MRLLQSIQQRLRLPRRRLILISVLTSLSVTIPFSAYIIPIYASDYAEKRADRLKEEKEAQKIHEALTNPKNGTTPELVAAVSIGMSAHEVQKTLEYGYSLGRVGMHTFPRGFSTPNGDWASDDIAIKGVGYIQAVFIDLQLVGLGSLDPKTGPLCGGCLEDMLHGERPRLEGLPFHVEGKCPVCGSNKVVPFGVRWGSYNDWDNVCCGIYAPMFFDY